MTYEYAVYFKLLLLCGYKDEMEQYVDNALAEQNPLSDIVLELAMAGSDDKKILSVLNEYLMQVNDSDIDYNKTVFDLVISFLKREYVEYAMPMKAITDLMHRIAYYTERYFEDPWHTMYIMGDLFYEAEEGYTDKEDYQRKFDAFLNDNICCSYPIALPKETFFKKLIKKIRKNAERG